MENISGYIIEDLIQSSICNFCKLDAKLNRKIQSKIANLEDFLIKKIKAAQIESPNFVKADSIATLIQSREGERKQK